MSNYNQSEYREGKQIGAPLELVTSEKINILPQDKILNTPLLKSLSDFLFSEHVRSFELFPMYHKKKHNTEIDIRSTNISTNIDTYKLFRYVCTFCTIGDDQ